MSRTRNLLPAALSAAVFLVLVALVFAQVSGALGMLLGFGAGLFGVYALYLSVKILRGTNHSPTGVLVTLLAFFMKFPMFFVTGYLALKMGMPALICYVIGVLVVYFALVWRAMRSDLY